MAMRLISEGAEAQILSAEVLGISAVVKRRIRKEYRARQLDEAIMSSRAKTEARILALATTNGINAPVVLLIDGFDLYMSRIDGVRPGRLSKTQAREAGIILSKLHNLGIAHGDFTPANLLVSGGKLYVIDFGLAEITRSIEEKALDLLLMNRSVGMAAAKSFLSGYSTSSAEHTKVVRKLKEIEMRGRYQSRTLAPQGTLLQNQQDSLRCLRGRKR
ncbi:MAG: Kae1-associated serine/threonine protein kinase [Candidatus Micrarchaeota archaeon]|nr:Kae1-associated serine/threonine protein kinase [Candidatus Micrarchaeota archaeon]